MRKHQLQLNQDLKVELETVTTVKTACSTRRNQVSATHNNSVTLPAVNSLTNSSFKCHFLRCKKVQATQQRL